MMRQITITTPHGQLQQDAYCVDGRVADNPDADWANDGEFAPFVIFDIEAQTNLPGRYDTRADAEFVMERLA